MEDADLEEIVETATQSVPNIPSRRDVCAEKLC